MIEQYENLSRPRLWLEGHVRELKSLAFCLRPKPAKRFVIYAQGRTGSTLLSSLLDSHPQITCPDEILRRRTLFPRLFIENMSRGASTPVFGFHLKCYQLDYHTTVRDQNGFLKSLLDSGWSIIHLRREDVFAHAFSSVFAARIKTFAVSDSDDRSNDPESLVVDTSDLVRRVRKRLALREIERRALDGLPHFEMSYEQDLLDPDVRIARVTALLRSLDIEPAPMKTRFVKAVRRSPWEMIQNADEVRLALQQTGLEHVIAATS